MLMKLRETHRVESESEAQELVRNARGSAEYDLVKSTIAKKYDKKEMSEYFIVVLEKNM